MIDPKFYYPIFLYTVIGLTFIQCSRVQAQPYQSIRKSVNNLPIAVILCAVFAIFLGQRPHSGRYFGDTANYAYNYSIVAQAGQSFVTPESGDAVWFEMMKFCTTILDASGYFTLVSILYFGFTLWACKRLIPNNPLIAVLFVIGAYSFFSYGTNGIRNGLACSMVLLFLSYLNGGVKDKIVATAIAFFAIGIHKTTMLPISMAVVSMFVIHKFKTAYSFWILSIFISLVAGGAVTAMFASLGFDDRLSYLTEEADAGMFSHTGFRFDFLLYSMMPIVLGYYVVIKRGIRNQFYEFLLNTYTLSNAFWVMVIRANYSNRFAYLSWFMYPLVLAYPLLKLDIWHEQQGKWLSKIMLAQVAFTWIMSFV